MADEFDTASTTRKEAVLAEIDRSHHGPVWRGTAGSLGSMLMRLDGQVATVVHDEKQSIGSVGDTVALRERAQLMVRLVEEMGGLVSETDAAIFGEPDRASVLEPIKPTFTREAGSSPWTDSAARNLY